MRLFANQPVGTVPRARQLRRDAPGPERRRLRGLRENLGGLKWRHQAPVGPFYADTLRFSERSVIEVDGDTHAGAELRDGSRDMFMARQGFRVPRFSDHDVMANLDGVLRAISAALTDKEKGSTT